MKCDEIRELLSLYIDNMLDESERKTVEDHLSACDVCRKEYNEIKETIDLLGQAETIPVPDAFHFRLKKALQEEKRNMAGPEIIGKASHKKIRWRVITSVAAVLFVGVLSFGFYHDILGSLSDQFSGGEQAETAKADSAPSETDNALPEEQPTGLQPTAKAEERAAVDMLQDVPIKAQKKEAAFSSNTAADTVMDADAATGTNKGNDRVAGAKADTNGTTGANTNSNEAADSSQMTTFGAAVSPDPNVSPEYNAMEDQSLMQNSKITPPSEECSRSASASGIERNTAVVKYYDKLISEKLKGFDYQILDYSYAQTGEWQFRVFIFRGKDGNTYNEEILIIGKEGEIKTICSNKITELLNYENDNN